jgi:hypothetical protein
MKESEFEELVPKIAGAVKSVLPAALSSDVVLQLAGHSKLLGLNRTGFRAVVKALCRYLRFTPDRGELELFVKSRDYLVHTGEFYCDAAKPNDRAKVTPLPDATKEFFFLVSFLDRLFLKLLGYSGLYADWRRLPEHDQSSELL